MLTVKTFTVNPLQENCYVASDETRECVIIDCGAYTAAERRTISDYITLNKLFPKRHLLTHAHADHCVGSGFVYNEYGLRPELHLSDAPLVEAYDAIYGFTFGGVPAEPLPDVGRYFTEADAISFGTHTLSVLAVPGHTPGSVVLYCEAEKTAFTGDTLFCGSVGRTDLPGGSMFMLIQSLRALCQLDDDTAVFPGHGEATTIGRECATNPFIDR